jgi:hypothetical protein
MDANCRSLAATTHHRRTDPPFSAAASVFGRMTSQR